jgi:hypothetical protein
VPWEVSAGGLLPTEKWFPVSWPPYSWETRQPPLQPMQLPTPPEGFVEPWWYNRDKSTWPYQPVPWPKKVLNAFTPRKVIMRENIGAPITDPPGSWPPNVKYPQPSGIAKVNTTPDHQLGYKKPLTAINVHMLPDVWLDISPHPSVGAEAKLHEALRIMTHKRPLKLQNEDGNSITIKSWRAAPWNQHQKEYRKRKAAQQLNFL